MYARMTDCMFSLNIFYFMYFDHTSTYVSTKHYMSKTNIKKGSEKKAI